MELDEQGNPIIPEDLKNKPQTDWTFEDWERSGGSGRTTHTVGPAEVAAGAVIAPGLTMKAIKAWGAGKVLDAGMQIAFPDAEDTKLEQALDFNKPIKTGFKATRLLYEEIGKSIFDQRLPNTPEATSGLLQALHQHPQIGKLSKLQKQTDNRNILDQYLHKKAVEGPHKSWQDQGVPQTELSRELSDVAKRTDAQFSKRDPELPIDIRLAGYGMGFKDGTFYFDDYLSVRKNIPEGDRRWFAGIFTQPVEYGVYRKGLQSPKAYEAFKKNSLAEFMKTYDDKFLKAYGIDKSKLQLHHIDALLASLPLYDGVKYLSPEWMDITGTLLKKEVHPGNMSQNLIHLVGTNKMFDTPHGITHKYIDEVAGPDGQRLFTEKVRENMRTLKGPYTTAAGETYPSYRNYMTNRWAEITKKSEDIANQASGVFNAINADIINLRDKDIDKIMQSIGRLEANGLVNPKVIEGQYQIGVNQIKKVIFDMDFDIGLSQYFPTAKQADLNALKDAISSNNPISAYKAIKAQLPEQLRLFTDTKVKKLNKQYRRHRNPKWDIPDKPDDPIGIDTGELDEFGKPKY